MIWHTYVYIQIYKILNSSMRLASIFITSLIFSGEIFKTFLFWNICCFILVILPCDDSQNCLDYSQPQPLTTTPYSISLWLHWFRLHIKMSSYCICLSFPITAISSKFICNCEWHDFLNFKGIVVFHCESIIFNPFMCWWTFRLILYISY